MGMSRSEKLQSCIDRTRPKGAGEDWTIAWRNHACEGIEFHSTTPAL